MTLEEIKAAIAAGHTVCWENRSYVVELAPVGYVIRCLTNGSLIGLTWRDGVTLNGREDQFFIA